MSEIREADLMENITYISHQSYLFKGTVRDNLLMGKPDASDSELWEVLERVNLADFVRNEKGLDTGLSEKASNLSGGQCQRLALARALLHDSPIYIFDEATSNIDVESENDIMNEIQNLAESKTVILISHRLVNVVKADAIYVMVNGKIVRERENIVELLENKADYEKLWEAQQRLENYGKDGAVQCKKRSRFTVVTKLIGLVKPLTAYMALAVIMGIVGHLCASFITIFGGFAVLDLVGVNVPFSLTIIFISLAIFSVLRAALRYAEQACNHFIAFKLLALIRDKVFQALRKLCPAKLESKDKGDLISVITSDIELLEVFYAHTISPVLIWFFFTLIMTAFIASYHIWLGGLALIAYLAIGVIIPLIISKISGDDGMKFRSKSGALSGFVLDSLRGLSETIQYGQGQKRLAEMNKKTDELSADEERMKKIAGRNIAVTNTVILIFDFMMLFLSAYLYQTNAIGFDGILICTLALFSSFRTGNSAC